MSPAPKRVAIIGGGAAGLASCRCILEAGLVPVVFEETLEGVGGIWLGEKASRPVIYRGLVTNLPHQVIQFHDLPFSPGQRSYIREENMLTYLQAYARKYALAKHVLFGRKVTDVSRIDSVEGTRGAWKVTSEDRSVDSAGQPCTEVFDAVVVANGHYRTPYIPDIPGFRVWAEKQRDSDSVIHAADYRVATPFAGKTVLIVGANASGTDIAREVSQVADTVYILDQSSSRITQRGNRVRVPAEGVRILPCGTISLHRVPFRGKQITNVIFATGYQFTFPFFRDMSFVGANLADGGRSVRGLFLHLISPTYPQEVFFIGLPMTIAPFPLFETQARLCAAAISGTADLSPLLPRNGEATPIDIADSYRLLGPKQWDYCKDLLRRARYPRYEEACKRLDTVEKLYNDRVQRSPKFPGDPDTYRQVEYAVDWNSQTWSAAVPKL
ncbi:Flavin-containing monooxygenase FMO GS-OX1 [Diplonema papillatum]|nr:Flavin-containing monooxygenase FMO GS-OX1 [Diplonema papillatum]|eukprot:gene18145-27947_t